VAGAWYGWSILTTPGLIPGPGEIATAFFKLWTDGGVIADIITSYTTNLIALGGTVCISLVIAYLTAVPALRPFGTFVSTLRFASWVGLPFILTTVFLLQGQALQVWMLVFGMTVTTVTGMISIVSDVPNERLDHARTLGMSEWRVLWEVVVLGTRDQMLELIRQNAAFGWMMLTMVEGIVRSMGGVGVRLLNENKYLHLAPVLAIQITILLVGLVQDRLLAGLKKVVSPYASLRTERK
jgi:NitT/TauT family transport system permease protein